jgi:hypothetical protein
LLEEAGVVGDLLGARELGFGGAGARREDAEKDKDGQDDKDGKGEENGE